MINVIFEHEGKTIKSKMPSTWNELTVKQFLALEQNVSALELLAVLTNQDLSFLENTATDLTPAIERAIEIFNNKPPDLSKAPRKPVTIEGHVVNFPKKIEFTRYGQKSMIKGLISDNERLEAITADVFAIYAQPLIDGKFNAERIPKIKAKVEALPIIEVFPHVLFFFKKLVELKTNLQVR